LRNSVDPESHSTPASPFSSLPSVSSMAGKGKGSTDRVALAVFALALIIFVILVYGFLSRMNVKGSQGPVRSASQFLNDLERHVEGYLGEIERAFKPRKSGRQRAKKHILVGYHYYKEGKFDRAIGEFNRAIKVDPKNAEAYFWRGRALIGISRYNEATADFRMAVKLNPAYVDAYHNLGWLYARAGNNRDSITCLTKAIELKPDNGWAHYYRGRIHQEIGEVRMAMGDAKESCRLGFQDGCKMYERLKEEFLKREAMNGT
jgi:tetratricopeptide (TPR) repeat protein